MKDLPLNCLCQAVAEVSAQRVNRIDELRRLEATLLNTSGNVYLYGPRGVGKTFLLRMFEFDTTCRRSDVFIFFFPLDAQLACASTQYSDASAFPIAFLLSMISHAWRSLARRNYRDLLRSQTIETKRLRFEEDHFKAIKELHRAALIGTADDEYERESKIGASAVLKGEIKEKWAIRQSGRVPVAVDIHQHIEDLRQVLVKDIGITKIIALCDEANLLPVDWQKHIIANHLRIFSDKYIQYAFVAGFLPGVDEVRIPDFFEAIIELKGLSREALFELFAKLITTKDFEFEKSAFATIHSYSEGNPRIAFILAQDAAMLAGKAKKRIISAKMLDETIRGYELRISSRLKNHPKFCL